MPTTHSMELPIIPAQDELHPSVIACRTEIKRLRADRDTYNSWAAEIKIGVDALRADNERLRSALKGLVQVQGMFFESEEKNAAINVARAALGDQQGTDASK